MSFILSSVNKLLLNLLIAFNNDILNTSGKWPEFVLKNMDKQRLVLMFTIFVILWGLYFFNPYSIFEEENKLFFTVSTFLFSIYTGFFIARQGKRYSEIRRQISKFDGEMTTVYRVAENFGKKIQEGLKKIIRKHYDKILKLRQWDYYFLNKTTTIKEIQTVYSENVKENKVAVVKAQSLRITFNSLRALQTIRKQLVMLHNERISLFQWMLTILLALMLLTSLSVIPSYMSVLNSFIKAIASTFVVFMCVLLLELDRLKLFESNLGENSAQDVIDIINDKK